MEGEAGFKPNWPEVRPTIEEPLQEASTRFWKIARELERKKPDLFNPPSSEKYEQNRASLPWPLNQEGAGLYFRDPGGHKYEFQLKWDDEKGGNVVTLGYDFVKHGDRTLASDWEPQDPYYLLDFDNPEKVRSVYYERISGDDMFSYSEGYIVELDANSIPDPEKVEMKPATKGQWVISNDAIRLETILRNLKDYADSLPEPS